MLEESLRAMPLKLAAWPIPPGPRRRQALIYDLSLADPGLNPLGTQRFDVTSRLEHGRRERLPRSDATLKPWGGPRVHARRDRARWSRRRHPMGRAAGQSSEGRARHRHRWLAATATTSSAAAARMTRLTGLGGNDMITGGEDQDVLHGGRGNDRLDGGSGDDQLFGEADDDVLAGGEATTLVDNLGPATGGAGDDTHRRQGDGSRSAATAPADELVNAAADNGTVWYRAFEHGIDKIDVSALSLSNAARQELWLSTARDYHRARRLRDQLVGGDRATMAISSSRSAERSADAAGLPVLDHRRCGAGLARSVAFR